MSVETKTPFKACGFCGLIEDNELKYGKFYEHDGIVTHYYCLLLSSNMEQKGNDDEGILGFLTNDIRKEIRRGKKLVCSYCKKTGATLGCCNVRCKKIFHFPCGLKDGSLHQFFGEFRTYCRNHRPRQQVDRFVEEEMKQTVDILCYICYDTVSPCDINTLWAPCCKKNAWFHRKCVQQLAMSAGYFFKCPLCNNKKEFQKTMLEFGIFIPNQDASWELVPNAFQELLYRHDQCDAVTCLCPKGRKHISSNAKWELTLCRICGSQGIHMACGQLKWANPVWECEECTSILSRAVKSDRSQVSAITVVTNNQRDQVRNENNWSSSDDSDTDISVGCYSPLPPKAAPSNNQTVPESVFSKIRPGPRSYKLQQRIKANKMNESEMFRNIVSNETSDLKQKMRSPGREHAYNNDGSIYAEEYILRGESSSLGRNDNYLSNEPSTVINFTTLNHGGTVIYNGNDVDNFANSTKFSNRTLPRIKRICTRDHNNSTASGDVISAQSNIDRSSYKLLESEPNGRLSQDPTTETFAASASYSHNDAVNVKMISVISEQNNSLDLNTKRKSEVHTEVCDPRLERLKKVKKHENADNQSSASNNGIHGVNQMAQNHRTSTTASSLSSEVLCCNGLSDEEQQKKMNVKSFSVGEQSTDATDPLRIPDNFTLMDHKHSMLLTQLARCASESDTAIGLPSYNNVRTLVKTRPFTENVSKTYEDLSAATNCLRDTGYNHVNQSAISNLTYNEDYEKKRRKVHSLPSSELVKYSSGGIISNISILAECNSDIDSTDSIFSQVTSNPNTCDRPRLIPEYVHLRDLKFRVMNSDYIQMILYDTFSVTLGVSKCVNDNVRLNCKSLQEFYELQSLPQSEHTNEIFSREGTIECNLKCCNKFLDYLTYVSSNVDIQCKELPTANRINCDDDDTKENLDPVSSPTDHQSPLNFQNGIDRKTKLREYCGQADEERGDSHTSHNVKTTFLGHIADGKNGKTELFESNLSTNKSVGDICRGNSTQVLHIVEKFGKTFPQSYIHVCDLTLNVNNDAQVFQNTSPTNKYVKGCVCCTGSIHQQENPLLYPERLQNSVRKLKNIHVPSSDDKCLDLNSIEVDIFKKQNDHFLKDSIASLTEMRRVHNSPCRVSIDLRKIQKLLDSKPDLFCKYV